MLFSLTLDDTDYYKSLDNVKVTCLNYYKVTNIQVGSLNKLYYIFALKAILKAIRDFEPDIVHSHYLSSYGILGVLTGFHPLILSVWGSDIFTFPKISSLHRKIVKFCLSKADIILSTSNIMSAEVLKYTQKRVIVTPFGVDIGSFRPGKSSLEIFEEDAFVIGTIKKLRPKYGIKYLIEAFSIILKKQKNMQPRLLIVGSGTEEGRLKKLTEELGIQKYVSFLPEIPHDKIPEYFKYIDVFTALSISDSESFGVSIIEASACEIPVVVSNAGGLPEVVEDGKTGIVVPVKDIISAAEAIEKLIIDADLRLSMGRKGRERVSKKYNWNENVSLMVDIYHNVNIS